MALTDYLNGLRRELAAAERMGKTTVDEIQTEIGRVEKALGLRAAGPAPVERAVPAESGERAVGPAAKRRSR